MDEAEKLCDRIAIVDHGRIIALDTPRALIASLGAEHVVAFKVEEGSVVSEETLRALDGVTNMRRAEDAYELTSMELRRTVPALLAHVERQQLRLAELRTHSATLEDVFVSLTGRHLRDA